MCASPIQRWLMAKVTETHYRRTGHHRRPLNPHHRRLGVRRIKGGDEDAYHRRTSPPDLEPAVMAIKKIKKNAAQERRRHLVARRRYPGVRPPQPRRAGRPRRRILRPPQPRPYRCIPGAASHAPPPRHGACWPRTDGPPPCRIWRSCPGAAASEG